MIYKKQPITRKLPAGHTAMDAVDYLNVSAIKGLQIFDNPLIADQNSTYDCRNIYTDDLGNLTVRPALKQTAVLSNKITKIYTTSKGQFIQEFDGQNITITHNGILVLDLPECWSCIVFEYTSKVYAVTQSYGLNLYEYTDGKFRSSEGSIPLTSISTITIDDYNVLNTTLSIPDTSLANALSASTIPITQFLVQPVHTDMTKPEIIAYRRNYSVVKYDNYHIIQTTPKKLIELTESYRDKHPLIRDNEVIYYNYDSSLIGEIASTVYNTITGEFSDQYYKVPSDIDYDNVSCMSDGKCITWMNTAHSKLGITNIDTNTTESVDIEIETLPLGPAVSISNDYISVLSNNTLNIYDDACTLTSVFALGDLELVEFKLIGKYLVIVASNGPTQNNIVFFNVESSWTYTVDNIKSYSIIDSNESPMVVFPQDSMSVAIYNDKYYRSDDTMVVLDIPAMLVNDTRTTTIYGDQVILKPVISEIQRPADIIPVAGGIRDKLITTFTLDSWQWIITEHHIFGTGVDNNTGFPTVEYWDPAKYFEVSETITGAMRVSDTSFWVFHSDGAYLIYKTDQTIGSTTNIVWGITNTPKSKGCDFENAIITLPVTNYVATVTNSDISVVQMQKYIQSDDRSLVPITMKIRSFIADLLQYTDNIVIGNYKYLTLFALNGVSEDRTTVIVYDNATDNWWCWDYPVKCIKQFIFDIDTNTTKILADIDNSNTALFELSNDTYMYTPPSASMSYEVYADILRVDGILQPKQIDWLWESAMLLFKSLNYRKQLLQTTFTMNDTNDTDIDDSSVMNFKYHFKIYTSTYKSSPSINTEAVVTRARNFTDRTIIASFTFLQVLLKNQEIDDYEDYEQLKYLTKPKISSITFKYRTLLGGVT